MNSFDILKDEEKLISEKQVKELRRVVKGNILLNQPMQEYTSLGIGGPADVIVFPEDTDDVTRTIKYLNGERLPYFILGNGTNLLVRDGGIRTVVISLSDSFRHIEKVGGGQSKLLFAEAFAPLVSLIRLSIDCGLSGLEFAAGIPGTVGGGLVMNAGGSLGELKDVTLLMTILNRTGGVSVKRREDSDFSYRNLKLASGSIILSAIFRLKPDNRSHISERVQAILGRRKETQPLDLPNAGSIFKNPKGIPAGKLIDEAGLKGMRIGGAMVSERHGNFILNLGNATASDVLGLMKEIRDSVYRETGLVLEPEVKIIGEE